MGQFEAPEGRSRMSVKSDMCGKWKLESRDEHFESFLTCREVGWFLRKLMTTPANVYQEYRLSPDNTTFTKITSSMGRSTNYDMPVEGEYCPTKTLSGKQELGRLFETSGGNLILEMQCNDIISKAVYTKCDS